MILKYYEKIVKTKRIIEMIVNDSKKKQKELLKW